MRTIQVINCNWYNATAWYAVYLTKILNQNGHSSLLITVPDSVLIPFAQKLGVECIILPLNSFKPKDFFYSIQQIKKICRDFKPDIVNCHRGETFFLWAFLKKIYHYKLVRTRGDQRFPKNTFLNRFLHNVLADTHIVTNSKMAMYYENVMKINKNHINIILGGVDTEQFFPNKENRDILRKQYGFSKNDVVLGVIGRLEEVKGQVEAILAFKKALEQDGNEDSQLHLVIVGKTCTYKVSKLQKLVEEYQIPSSHIHFYSFFEDICTFMNLLDVGVISSIGSEAIARVAFELIACHVPVIGSSVGVMPDILEKDFMFSPANIEEMASLFLKVKDEVFRKRILESNLSRFYNKEASSIFGWTMKDFYLKTLKVYSNLLKD